jgi:hypothetical protein
MIPKVISAAGQQHSSRLNIWVLLLLFWLQLALW